MNSLLTVYYIDSYGKNCEFFCGTKLIVFSTHAIRANIPDSLSSCPTTILTDAYEVKGLAHVNTTSQIWPHKSLIWSPTMHHACHNSIWLPTWTNMQHVRVLPYKEAINPLLINAFMANPHKVAMTHHRTCCLQHTHGLQNTKAWPRVHHIYKAINMLPSQIDCTSIDHKWEA